MKNLLFTGIILLTFTSLNAQNAITNISGESSPGACDGSALFQFSTPAFGETVAILAEAPGLFPIIDTLSVPEGDTIGTVLFNGLCNGSYAIMTTDTIGFSHLDTLYFNITGADSLVITTSSTNETAQGPCDGTAVIAAFGGIGNISYTLIDQDSILVGSGTTYSNLCPGLYHAQAIDSVGNSASQSFLVVDAASIYGPPNIQDSVFIDTLSANAIQACNINYANVTDVALHNYYLTQTGDSIIVEWFIQTPDALPDFGYVITQVYYFDSTLTNGNIYATMDMYCPVTKALSGSLKAQGVINLSNLSLDEFVDQSLNFQLYPNPTKDFVSIKNLIGKYNLNIIDARGRTIIAMELANVKVAKIDISSLNKGIYYFRLNGGTKIGMQKLVVE